MQSVKNSIKNVVYPLIKAQPDFLILGAQKAGTTSLYNYLIQHPKILKNTSFKEVRYFDRDEHYNLGLGWYLGHFPSKLSKGDRLSCDASPNYLYYEDVPKLIKQDLGNIKMIAILREPASRAYSAWQMFHSFFDIDNDHLRPFYDSRNFSEAVKEEFEPDFDYHKYPFRYDYVDRGKYVYQFENYYKYFDKNLLMIISMDQLKKDRGGTLNKICDFLEIEQFSEEMLQKLEQEQYNVGKYKKEEKSQKDQETIQFLKEYYAPFNHKLYELLGYEYSW
ncbi:MAG: sulfotransferase domain-containing protein [Lyngbya sp.]|nr:sulfotransferase domain-containing protein [Lyngbya sp.]